MRKSWIAIIAAAMAAGANAQVSFTGNYSQNFDTLATANTNIAWTDNSTLAGWYMRRMDDVNGELADQYNAGDGSSTTGAVYSFGTGTATDRALGSVGSGSIEHAVYGIRLTNNTGAAINSLNLSFFTEEWRDGGNATSVAHRTLFSYSTTSTTVGADIQASGGVAGYTADPNFTTNAAFDMVSPVFTATAGPLDGNAAANRVAVNGTLTLNSPWANGSDIWLRWVDLNDVGSDIGMGLDNLTITSTPVPEPASMAVLGLGALALIRRRRARK